MDIKLLFSMRIIYFLLLNNGCTCDMLNNTQSNENAKFQSELDENVLIELDLLKRQLVELEEIQNDVKQQLDDSKNEIDILKQQLNNETRNHEHFKNDVKQQLDDSSKELDRVKQHLTNETRHRISLQKQVEALKTVKETPVAFAAHNTGTESDAPGYSGILKFNTIVTNLGNHYDSNTGQFTCPVRGLYVFMYNVLADYLKDGQGYIFARLRKDSDNIWHAYVRHSGSSIAEVNCGGSVILECEAGSVVDVHKEGDGRAHSGDDTWFTGMLIQPM